MKKYVKVRAYSQRGSGTKYILEITTTGGNFSKEFYEYKTKREVTEAYRIATYIKDHPYCKAEFEDYLNFSKTELIGMKAFLRTMKIANNFKRWALN